METLIDAVLLLVGAPLAFVCTLTSTIALANKASDLSIKADEHSDYKHIYFKIKSFVVGSLAFPNALSGAMMTALLVTVPTGLVTP